MKNFLELLDTKSDMKVSVKLQIHGYVEYRASINGIQFADATEVRLDLNSDINLVIHLDKFNKGSSGIEVTEFFINSLEVLPKYLHLARPSTNYIDEYGQWRFAIPAPFYSWYHEITGQGWLLKPT